MFIRLPAELQVSPLYYGALYACKGIGLSPYPYEN